MNICETFARHLCSSTLSSSSCTPETGYAILAGTAIGALLLRCLWRGSPTQDPPAKMPDRSPSLAAVAQPLETTQQALRTSPLRTFSLPAESAKPKVLLPNSPSIAEIRQRMLQPGSPLSQSRLAKPPSLYTPSPPTQAAEDDKPQSPEALARTSLRIAKEHIDRGNLTIASQTAEEGLKLYAYEGTSVSVSTLAELYLVQANCKDSMGLYHEAIILCRAGLALKPPNELILVSLYVILAKCYGKIPEYRAIAPQIAQKASKILYFQIGRRTSRQNENTNKLKQTLQDLLSQFNAEGQPNALKCVST